MSETDDSTSIRHHKVLPDAQANYEEAYVWRRDRLSKVVAMLPQRPDSLGRLIGDEIVAAGLAHSLFPDDPAVLGHLQAAGRLAGVAARLLMPDAPASVTLWLKERGLPPVEVPRMRPYDLRFGWGEAIQGFHAAFASREYAALDALAALPPELLDDERRGIEYSAFVRPEFRAMQALHLNAASFPDALTAWLKATNPETLPEWAIDWALYVEVQVIEMVMASVKGSTLAEFDRALTKALVCHKKYWATRDDISDLLALPALAFTCRKRDMGHRTTVRSDYLPMSVVEAWAPPLRQGG